jgi:predicted Fe-Mo cluster-binding NifX family protein
MPFAFPFGMKKTIAVFQMRERIAPRCDYAGEVVVATVGDEGGVSEKKTLHIPRLKPHELADLLHRECAEVVICGGIKEDAQNALKKLNIQWIDNVIGTVETVLRRYTRGDLQSGDIVD